mmetsp:Transcript_5611/g.12429  ORF Transcript_5611/g.12429 Transcript_5611/m.12429 type:complete len:480 (+) Transcript_5611:231-1670(+)|eukprot:CAMPEP_0202891676 /NCGR_PEP_ID=MMETSP1392-20130828/1675_1 /ASSEMBLY_ACC=CAM_ASM_000868 /TAXON_ID=225041 /ORGANISM="Chlamydomonas chlamydogama, Strain SAG 11-48b" /LENGTH=479 /DNA_ID=CAMNT_0049575501 /DNA_START=215 /DNA_END=1654 /DNA_ORIENTATION=+
MRHQVAIAFTLLLGLNLCQKNAAEPSKPSTVPSVVYELFKAFHSNHLKSVAVLGCRNHLLRQYYRKEPFDFTVYCSKTNCKKIPGGRHVAINLGGTTTIYTCWPTAVSSIPKHDALVLDLTPCSKGSEMQAVCSERNLAAYRQHAKTVGFTIFATINYVTMQLSVENLDTGAKQAFVEGGDAREVFTQIYESAIWGKGDDLGEGSGEGSNLNMTRAIRQKLVEVIKKYNIRSMIDAPCGSLHWMRRVIPQLGPGFAYVGNDVACSVIQQLNGYYGSSQDNWRFYCLDVCHQGLLPGYDLVFSRDTLQHLPLEYSFAFLRNVKSSGAKYLLVGSYIKDGANKDIKLGDYYLINLLAPPFRLRPGPLEVIDEETPATKGHTEKKFMLLFNVSALQWDDYHTSESPLHSQDVQRRVEDVAEAKGRGVGTAAVQALGGRVESGGQGQAGKTGNEGSGLGSGIDEGADGRRGSALRAATAGSIY